MNGPILIGAGIAVMVWGGVLLFNGQQLFGLLLVAGGLAIAVFGKRQPRK